MIFASITHGEVPSNLPEFIKTRLAEIPEGLRKRALYHLPGRKPTTIGMKFRQGVTASEWAECVAVAAEMGTALDVYLGTEDIPTKPADREAEFAVWGNSRRFYDHAAAYDGDAYEAKTVMRDSNRGSVVGIEANKKQVWIDNLIAFRPSRVFILAAPWLWDDTNRYTIPYLLSKKVKPVVFIAKMPEELKDKFAKDRQGWGMWKANAAVWAQSQGADSYLRCTDIPAAVLADLAANNQ